MKTRLLTFVFFAFSFNLTTHSQVGVGNTNPQATLDISASSTTSPANNDGILIPRMINFPSAPGATRDGMLIFYIGTGADGKGFYFWNLTTTSWEKIASGNLMDLDWLEVGGSTAPNNINDNIFTRGKVNIGSGTTPSGVLQINNNLSTENEAVVINNTGFRPGGSGYGINNIFTNSRATSDDLIGLNNQFANLNGTLFTYGVKNDFGQTQNAYTIIGVGNRFAGNNPGVYGRIGFNTQILGGNIATRGVRTTSNSNYTINASVYGMDTYLGASGSGDRYGVNTNITGTGSGTKYGIRNFIDNIAGGIHYGVYSEVLKSNSYAGFFLGRLSVGTTNTNNYILPASRGTSGQVMTTDGSGNVTFQTPTNGDINQVNAGNGLTGGGAVGNVTVNAVGVNGITTNANDFRLGGALIQNTAITQGTRSFDINLNSSGDFAIQNNGTDVFFVEDSGDIGFGVSNPEHPLHIVESLANEREGIYVDKNDNTTTETNGIYVEKSGSGTGRSHAIRTRNDGTGTGQKYGLFNTISATSAGNQYGVRNFMSGNTTAWQFATFNNIDNSATGNQYGVYNGMRGASAANLYGVYNEFERAYSGVNDIVGVRNRFSNGTPGTSGMIGVWTDFLSPASGNYYGSRNEFQAGSTGAGYKYGTYNLISSSAGGTHYGSYNQVDSTNGWAGYFLGRSYISERLGIGENNNTVGRLAIATNSGASNVHIELKETGGNDGSRIRFSNPSEDATNWWTMYGRIDGNDADSQFNIYYGGTGTNLMRLEGDGDLEFIGNLSVNFNNPTYALQLPNNGAIGTGQARANAWTTYSDSRVKSNQQQLESGLSLINQMTPKTYFHHNGNIEEGLLNISDSGEETLGFIAQELYEVLPEAVQKPEDENEALWSINYDKVIPVAVKAIQELNTKVEALETENKSLKQQLNKLKQLEARLLALENGNISEIPSIIKE